MSRKLIALDLDGTTLNADGALSPHTIDVLRTAQAAGHLVVITTGRPDSLSQHFYDEIGLTGPMINFNGGLIHVPHAAWEKEQAFGIPVETALDLRALKDDFPIRVAVAEGKQLLLADHGYTGIPFLPDLPNPTTFFDENGLTRPPISVTLFIEESTLPGLQAAVATRYPELVGRTWGAWSGQDTALEITTNAASKSRGVAYVADAYGIAQKDIIAFGDDMNDLDMLEFAGAGIAMKNARKEILAVANATTAHTNAHDGVAHFLADYLAL